MRRRRVAAQRSTKAEVAITANQVEAKRASMRWHGIAAHLKTDNERSTNAEPTCAHAYTHHSETESFHIT